MFLEAKNALVFKKGNETLLIEPWGKDSLRIRSTMERELVDRPWALTEKVKSEKAKIKIENGNGSITNGKIEARVNGNGIITLLKDGKIILHEYFRSYDPSATKESCCTKVIAREWKGIIGGDYKLTVRFEANDGEKLFGSQLNNNFKVIMVAHWSLPSEILRFQFLLLFLI